MIKILREDTGANRDVVFGGVDMTEDVMQLTMSVWALGLMLENKELSPLARENIATALELIQQITDSYKGI